MTRQTIITLIIGFLVLSCGVNKSVPKIEKKSNSDEIILEFARHLEYDVKQDNIGSISAAVFDNKKIIWSNAFGLADTDRGIKAGTNTVYRTASISKSITAYLMMLLIQNGTIGLDDPVKKFLPEITHLLHDKLLGNTYITFKHLASHTSGLAREPDLPLAATGPIEEWEKKVLNSIPTTRLIFDPGEKYAYSNIGYGILGLALSRATEKPFMQLIDEMVFKPLKMNNSFFIIPEGDKNKVAAGYNWHPFTGKIDAEKAKLEHKGRGYKVPNGGIYSTPSDLARFLMAQCGNSDLLTTKYLQMMQTIQTQEDDEYGYGLGFSIRNNDKGIKMVEHDGGVIGYNAYMAFNPESGIGVIMMRNYNFGLTNMLLEPRTLLSRLVHAQQLKKEYQLNNKAY